MQLKPTLTSVTPPDLYPLQHLGVPSPDHSPVNNEILVSVYRARDPVSHQFRYVRQVM